MAATTPAPAARGSRTRPVLRRPWVVVPAVTVGATLLSGAWWDPSSWVEFVTSIIGSVR